MDNLFSLLRFAIPGLISVCLTLVYFIIASPCPIHFLKELKALGVFEFVSAALLTISLGFISSVLYRIVYKIHGLNHINAANFLLKNGLIVKNLKNEKRGEIPKRCDKSLVDFCRGRIDAYQILTLIWHDKTFDFDRDKGTYQGHLINSFGSAMSAVVVSIIAIFFSHLFFSEEFFTRSILICLVICVVVFLLFFFSWRQTKILYSQWIDGAITSEFLKLPYSLEQSENSMNEMVELIKVRKVYFLETSSKNNSV